MVVATDKRDGRQQLVGDAEQRPERVDAAQRVAHALVQEIAPRQHDRRAGADHAGHPIRSPEGLGNMAQEILQHEAAHARAGVDDREDEQRLEHDGEVIPEAQDGAPAAGAGEDVRHAERQRGRAAGAVKKRLFAHARRERRHLRRGHREAPGGNGGRAPRGSRRPRRPASSPRNRRPAATSTRRSWP